MINHGDLLRLGFTPRLAQLYLACLRRSSGTAAELAQAAGLKRTTVYELLDELCQRQLLSESSDGNRRIYVAENPEQLLRIESEREEMLHKLLPQLNELYADHKTQPRVRYFEGLEGLRLVHEELLRQPNGGEYFYIGSILSFARTLGEDYWSDFTRRRIRKRIWSNALRIRSQEIDRDYGSGKAENYRRVRYLKSLPLTSELASLTLVGDRVIVTSSGSDYFGMIIEGKELFNTLKLVWDCLWEVAEE